MAELLADPSAEVRAYAAWAGGTWAQKDSRFADRDLIPVLRRLAQSDPVTDVRAEAVSALTQVSRPCDGV